MKIPNTRTLITAALVGALTLTVTAAQAGETGHYTPGVVNIRDFTVPGPGFYGAVYNYWYLASRLNDRNGNEVSSVTIGPGGGPSVTLGVDVDVNVYVVLGMFIWVSDWNVLGAKYAAYVVPSFANSSVSASLSTASGSGRNASSSQFALSDLLVQPLWLGWSLTNWDFALGYGFYAPVGFYHTETVTLPVIGPMTTEASDNIGLGFWTHQMQGSASWYPWADKRMAVSGVLTYEIHGKKEDFDLTPGQNLTFNWGVSQYLPLEKEKNLLMEIGLAGYDSWQITDDKGTAAKNPGVHDQVHAVGGQLGLNYVPWLASLTFHGFFEFSAKDRFQGHSLGLSIAKSF